MDENTSRETAIKIKEAVTAAAPKDARFIIIYAIPGETDFGITANVPDEYAVALLEETIKAIQSSSSEGI